MELEILRHIQSIANPFFDFLFQLITMCGEQIVLISIISIIYWALDKKFGEYIAYSVLTSVLLNNAVKDIFKMKRPIGEEGIRTLREKTATGYSFPSGHTQSSASFYGAMAIYLKKKAMYIIATIMIISIGFSRLYLGVHYPKDVIVGGILGVLTSLICYKLYNRFENKMLLYVITFIVFIPALTFAHSADFIKGMGTYLGFVIGMYIEKKYVNFSIEGSTTVKVIRVLLGISILLVLQVGLKAIFPSETIFSFIRYALISFVGIGIYPMIFKKFKF
ncbi:MULTISPECIES: phosphatase PAP2 family protein [unclassified Clostridium]|uniref:phosphatase PAP2 family protein n=1 Tax=unclassified Clostridium TaxID=2614128 RepID=UPI001C8B92FF|nr:MULTISPECIES: phosphatase PAP2 family protein [unclassified Clostridium]MBX9138590.1 phosphatase PAP2 family protein [Clostridium sp. K12(2020)]MBX9145338.1 phosphatase PAP2 family protein [Clostridium sp. K13]MDU4325130.1 phosphatase PAP2 family protein [Clostridium celatum]